MPIDFSHLLDNAVDGVPDVLPGGDEERADDEDDEGGLVVEPEDIVVDADGVELDQPLDGAEHVEHGGGRGVGERASGAGVTLSRRDG